MVEYPIGKLIKGFRESKKISQKKLYYGLNKDNAIYKIEKGEREMSKLMVDILFERMGLSNDLYGYAFSIKEYQLFQLRADLLEILEAGDISKAERKILQYEKSVSGKDVLQEQFIRTVKLLISLQKGKEKEALLQEAREILFLTVPQFEPHSMKDYLFSRLERLLIAVWAELLCRSADRKKEGIWMYYNLLFYMEENCTDLWEKEQQIPATILLLVRWLWETDQYSEMWICEKGIKILQESMQISFLEPLLSWEIASWKKGYLSSLEPEEIVKLEAGLKALMEIKKEYGEEVYENEYTIEKIFASMLKQNTRGQIMGENIRKARKRQGETIEQFAEGICERETLRRIEKGLVKPRQKTLEKFREKIGYEDYIYQTHICSEDYHMHESYQKIRIYISQSQFEKAEYELKKLESGLDLTNKRNQQVLLKLNGVIKERLKKIDLEEKRKFLEQALQLTFPMEEKIENCILSRVETVLWNDMAGTLEQQGKRKEAVEILWSVKKAYEKNAVAIENSKNEYMMILCNLSVLLGKAEQSREALEVTDEALRLSLKWKQGNYLILCLYNKAWNMEKIAEMQGKDKEHIKKSCLPLLRQDFAIADIMQCTRYKHHIERHCKEYYDVLLSEEF